MLLCAGFMPAGPTAAEPQKSAGKIEIQGGTKNVKLVVRPRFE
jgi:hypothetical protein